MKNFLKIEGIHSLAADAYSFMARINPVLQGFYKTIADEVCIELPTGRILDVGTGPGNLVFEIAKRSPQLEIIGIDISPSMIKIAGNKAMRMGFSKQLKFQVANAADLPFEDEYFDLVISSLSLHHWANPIKSINEIHRVLKQNGRAWIYDIRQDTSNAVNAQVREKYGWFISFLFLNIVRMHSSVNLGKIEQIVSSPEISFDKKSVAGRGILVKLKLLK